MQLGNKTSLIPNSWVQRRRRMSSLPFVVDLYLSYSILKAHLNVSNTHVCLYVKIAFSTEVTPKWNSNAGSEKPVFKNRIWKGPCHY